MTRRPLVNPSPYILPWVTWGQDPTTGDDYSFRAFWPDGSQQRWKVSAVELVYAYDPSVVAEHAFRKLLDAPCAKRIIEQAQYEIHPVAL